MVVVLDSYSEVKLTNKPCEDIEDTLIMDKFELIQDLTFPSFSEGKEALVLSSLNDAIKR